MTSENNTLKKSFGQSHTNLYKELEHISTNVFKRRCTKIGIFKKKPEGCLRSQSEVFQKATKVMVFLGQFLGLNPVLGIFDDDWSKLRFKYISFKFVYCALICAGQGLGMSVSLVMLLKYSDYISPLSFVWFYGSCCVATLIFIQVGKKWPILAKKVSDIGLDEYTDQSVVRKCHVTVTVLLLLGVVEHLLSFISASAYATDCFPEGDRYKAYNLETYRWFYAELRIPYSIPVGLMLQIFNIISTLTWNFSNIFVICISFYLSSILKKINEKLIYGIDQNSPTSFWELLREDYTRATELVCKFSDVLSALVFTSFATNVFFICLQLFFVFANGISMTSSNIRGAKCNDSPSGLFNGYEHAAYFSFSIVFLIGRFLLLSLVAADIHTASIQPGKLLHGIRSDIYCEEIARFIEQVKGNFVALNGLQFFYVRRELVLSIAATIVTYELVLLQFSQR